VQLSLQILVLLLLALVWIEDLRYRAVSWVIFTALWIGMALLRSLSGESFGDIWPQLLVNVGLLLIILLLLTLYLLIRSGRLVNITKQHLGSGDILFLLLTACSLSVLNFLFFFVTSLVFTGLVQVVWWTINKNKHIPLAGIQALLLILFLSSDWWYFHQEVTNDNWLLQFYTPWIQS
jgi:Flp pilus assembly protein protease CpaA